MPPETSHPEELGLLQAIHAAPRDDGLRLIYADWLEEHAEADLAEFIRLSVAWEKAHTGRWIDASAPGKSQDRIRELTTANHARWLPTIPVSLAHTRAAYDPLRPFVGGLPLFAFDVTCLGWKEAFKSVAGWVDHRCQVHVRLSIVPRISVNSVAFALADTFLDRVVELSVYGQKRRVPGSGHLPITAEQAAAVAACPRLDTLMRLRLGKMTGEAEEIVKREIAHRVPTEVNHGRSA